MSFYDHQENINHQLDCFFNRVDIFIEGFSVKDKEWDEMTDLYEYISGR